MENETKTVDAADHLRSVINSANKSGIFETVNDAALAMSCVNVLDSRIKDLEKELGEWWEYKRGKAEQGQ